MTTTAPAPAAAAVAIVHWPRDAIARVRARATGTPCLLLIEPGTAPPTDCALDEDWTTTTAPPADVASRLATVARRPRPPRRHRLPVDVAAALDDAAIAVYDVLAASAPREVPVARLGDVAHGDPTAVLARLRRALRGGDVTIVTVAGGVLLAGLSARGR
jgi:hypothetical protein